MYTRYVPGTYRDRRRCVPQSGGLPAPAAGPVPHDGRLSDRLRCHYLSTVASYPAAGSVTTTGLSLGDAGVLARFPGRLSRARASVWSPDSVRSVPDIDSVTDAYSGNRRL